MNIRVLDGHCDTAFELWYRGCGLENNHCHIDLQRAGELSAYAQVFAFCSYAGRSEGAPCSREEFLTLPLARLRREVERLSGRVGFARSGAQVLELWQQGRAAALLSVEGPELIGCRPEGLDFLAREGFVMTTLTWNADNALAGCHLGDGGLSGQGRDFVRRARELGLLVDVSHLSDRAFWDLMAMDAGPVLASHSNCRALCPVSRNLTDDQIRAIADCGGTVGLNFYADFIGEGADLSRLQAHLEHIMDLGCPAALGGDLDGCERLPAPMRDVGGYRLFYEFLRNKGYPQPLLEEIFWKNLLGLL